MTYGIEGAGGYESFTVWRYVEPALHHQQRPALSRTPKLQAGSGRRRSQALRHAARRSPQRALVHRHRRAGAALGRALPPARRATSRTRCTSRPGTRSSACTRTRTSCRAPSSSTTPRVLADDAAQARALLRARSARRRHPRRRARRRAPAGQRHGAGDASPSPSASGSSSTAETPTPGRPRPLRRLVPRLARHRRRRAGAAAARRLRAARRGAAGRPPHGRDSPSARARPPLGPRCCRPSGSSASLAFAADWAHAPVAVIIRASWRASSSPPTRWIAGPPRAKSRSQDDIMTLPALGRSFQLRTAVRFLSVIEGTDAHGLLGRVKTDEQLAEMSGEHYGASVILGDVGYECEEGFVGLPVDGGASGLLEAGRVDSMPPLFPATLALYAVACALYLAHLMAGSHGPGARGARRARGRLRLAGARHRLAVHARRCTRWSTRARRSRSPPGSSCGAYLLDSVRIAHAGGRRAGRAGDDGARRRRAPVAVARGGARRDRCSAPCTSRWPPPAWRCSPSPPAAPSSTSSRSATSRRTAPGASSSAAPRSRRSTRSTAAASSSASRSSPSPSSPARCGACSSHDELFTPQYSIAAAAWIMYAVLLVARVTAGWRGRRAALLTLGGFATSLTVLLIYFVRGVGGAAGLAWRDSSGIVGLSHKTAPIEVRERVAFAEDALRGVAARAASTVPGVGEAMIVSTCNRVELYAGVDDADALEALRALPRRRARAAVEPARAPLRARRRGGAAPPVPRGRRRSTRWWSASRRSSARSRRPTPSRSTPARSGRCCSGRCRAPSRWPSGCAPRPTWRAARRRSRRRRSIWRAQIFGELDGRHVLVVGAGKMGDLSARHLKAAGIGELSVVNRTAGARRRAGGEARRRGRRRGTSSTRCSTKVDIVLCSTGATEPVIAPRPRGAGDARAQGALALLHRHRRAARRRARRSATSRTSTSTTSTRSRRWWRRTAPRAPSEADEAEAMVDDELKRYARARAVARRGADDQAVARALPRGGAGRGRAHAAARARRPATARSVQAMAEAIVNKLLHVPLTKLKKDARRAPRQRAGRRWCARCSTCTPATPRRSASTSTRAHPTANEEGGEMSAATTMSHRHARLGAGAVAGQLGARPAAGGRRRSSTVELLVLKTRGDKILDRALSRGRRQGALRQGDRGGAARRARRRRRALDEGSAGRDPRRARCSARCPSARIRATRCWCAPGARRARRGLAAAAARASAPRACAASASSARAGPISTSSPLRGNVDTRLRKVDAGELDAIVLACAGLKRLGYGGAHHRGAVDGGVAAGHRAGRARHRVPRRRRRDAARAWRALDDRADRAARSPPSARFLRAPGGRLQDAAGRPRHRRRRRAWRSRASSARPTARSSCATRSRAPPPTPPTSVTRSPRSSSRRAPTSCWRSPPPSSSAASSVPRPSASGPRRRRPQRRRAARWRRWRRTRRAWRGGRPPAP